MSYIALLTVGRVLKRFGVACRWLDIKSIQKKLKTYSAWEGTGQGIEPLLTSDIPQLFTDSARSNLKLCYSEKYVALPNVLFVFQQPQLRSTL